MRALPLIAASLAAALTLASPATAALKPGAPAADFTTKAAKAGKAFDFTLSRQLKKGAVVLYFFPAAFTSGCTVEANQTHHIDRALGARWLYRSGHACNGG